MAKGSRVKFGNLQSYGDFPKQELFGLTSQLRRAAGSSTSKHCRGMRKKRRARVGSIFKNCARIGK
ncbi:MAG: four helix bundle protein [Nitrospirota bacterium]